MSNPLHEGIAPAAHSSTKAANLHSRHSFDLQLFRKSARFAPDFKQTVSSS